MVVPDAFAATKIDRFCAGKAVGSGANAFPCVSGVVVPVSRRMRARSVVDCRSGLAENTEPRKSKVKEGRW